MPNERDGVDGHFAEVPVQGQTGSDAVLFSGHCVLAVPARQLCAQHNSVASQFPVSGIEGSTDEQRTYRDIS